MSDYLDEIVGQSTAKRFIRTALKKGNLYNFLFTGPRGVGKRQFGFALARELGCPPVSPHFILIAPIPSRIKEKEDKISEYSQLYMPDNPIIEAEDRVAILIEQIRSMIERLIHMPIKDVHRVILILEADQMTDEAANCFLKTLEEPPIDTFFILTSSRPHYLLPTIRSRCRTVPFSYLTSEQIRNIIFDEDDKYILGSPGELLAIREHELIQNARPIFDKAPLTPAAAATCALEWHRKTVTALLYPLLLLYRCVLYQKISAGSPTIDIPSVPRKAQHLSLEKITQTILILNQATIMLEQNANRLLLLYDLLMKFICNGMMGKLCKLLRMCGIDTEYSNEGTGILLKARKEDRIVLTRNTRLKTKPEVFFVELSDPHQQFRSVVTHFHLQNCFAFMTRCLECNTLLVSISKDQVKGKVPFYTHAHFDTFAQCPVCRRIYWEGSHYQNMLEEIRSLVRATDDEE